MRLALKAALYAALAVTAAVAAHFTLRHPDPAYAGVFAGALIVFFIWQSAKLRTRFDLQQAEGSVSSGTRTPQQD